jgi:hypothetical protein
MTPCRTILIAVLTLFLAVPARAERFENAYLSFHLPDGWSCKQEETEFVCFPATPLPKDRPATMIMTAKIPGQGDTLGDYLEHLRVVARRENVSVLNKPAQIRIRDVLWIDATLLNAEVPNFYTRYLATVSNGVAVLYTFSFHKSYHEEFYWVSESLVKTLKIKPLRVPRNRK